MKATHFKILIVDDEEDILQIIRYNLEKESYLTETARDGEEALEKARGFLPDLILLDIMMPRKNGIEILKTLRKNPLFTETRIAFLTALGDEQSEITGLNLGADDYIVKPIKPRLLISRIQAILRRIKKEDEKILNVGNLMMNRNRFIITYRRKEIILARKEFELLELLASLPGKVFLRNEILKRVWGADVIVGNRTVDVHIRKIRKKTENELISTVKGVGYKLGE